MAAPVMVEGDVQVRVEDAVDEATERIEAEVCTLAGQIAGAMCRFILLIAELDRRESWKEWGCASMAHWLSWKCALALGTAREHVRVGRSLEELPLTREAFGEGRLSFSKVRAITRVANPEREADLVEFALVATASQLERTVRIYEKTRGDVEKEAARRDRQRIRQFSEPDGMSLIEALVPHEVADLFREAIDKAMNEVSRDEPDVPAETYRVDALRIVLEAFLAGRNDRPPTETVVHVDADELSPNEITPYVERLLCDTSVRGDVKRNGVHLVGIRKQNIPRWLRRRLAKRDKGMCRFPGCANSLYKQVHHLWHEAHGGPTDAENCLLLCSFHHRLVHEGGWHAFGNADDVVTFVSPRGKRFNDVPAETSPAIFRPIYGPDEHTIQTATGERFNPVLGAHVMHQICGGRRSDN